ncbi:MAG: type-F conjugative transfer system secretin TraK [Deltaproteobacteria bacterium]|nr:type-F conjugative transfer system secretin TraK [Deltaproteobacteria bacterium]
MKSKKIYITVLLSFFSFLLITDYLFAFVSVPPDIPTRVIMSATNINRVACTGGEIKDVIYAKEQEITVKAVGENVFIRFPIASKAGLTMDIYIVCNDTLYSIITESGNVPAVTVQLENKKNIKGNISVYKGVPTEEKALRFIRMAYKEEYPDSFRVVEVKKEDRKPHIEYNNIDVLLKRIIRVEGEGVEIREYIITPKIDTELREIDFMPLAKKPLAIAFSHSAVVKNTDYRLFIVDSAMDMYNDNEASNQDTIKDTKRWGEE